jgi:hypothetical protein
LSQPFPESITVGELLADSMDLTFLGIKIGDLTCLSNRPERQTNGTTWLQTTMAPNPTHAGAILTLELTDAVAVQLQIMDTSGKLVFETAVTALAGSQNIQIPASAMTQPGVYFWQVRAGERVESGKLVKF